MVAKIGNGKNDIDVKVWHVHFSNKLVYRKTKDGIEQENLCATKGPPMTSATAP